MSYKVTKRNIQIRFLKADLKKFREELKGLADFLGDAIVVPSIPKKYQDWMAKEAKRI